MAGMRADPAMLHLLAVFLTSLAADFAGLDAGSQLRAAQDLVRRSQARHQFRGGQANVRAIIAIADALDDLRHIFLTETGVRAGIARFRARIAGRDAFDVNRVVGGRIHGMRFEHLFDVAHRKVLR